MANKEAKQREAIERHSQLRLQTASSGNIPNKGRSQKKVNNTERENLSPKDYYANLDNPMIIRNPIIEDARFTRGNGKLDDSFYETRVNSLSKSIVQRQIILEDITNTNTRQSA